MRICFLMILTTLMVACGEKSGNSTAVKLDQYKVEGERLYVLHCSNCHGTEGQGLAKLYPPVAKSDFMEDNIEQVMCIMKNGLEGEIKVNGTTFNQMMPPNPRLTPLEIAEIATYLYNSWGRSEGLIDVKQAQEALKACEQ